MKVYIPTRGRPTNQVTLEHFPKTLVEQETVVLVIDEDEQELYGKYDQVKKMVVPNSIKGISGKRKFIVENTTDPRIVMLDDDLRFYVRKSPTDWHLRYLEPSEYHGLLGLLDEWFDQGFAHCGVSAREGNNRVEALRAINTRYMRVLAYNLEEFPEDIVWGRTEIMEDFDIALQLLRKGKACSISYYYAQGQKSSNAEGGCSEWRTMEVQSAGAELLASLHPTCVQVVEKSTKTAWDGQTRKDVRVGWKKAFKEGAKNGVV
jgi:glycosyltransferase involved in cell wall biosynthesis